MPHDPIGTAARRGSLRRELARKAFHLSSSSLPLLAWVLPRLWAQLLLVGIAVVGVGLDVARLQMRPVRYHFLRLTRPMLRQHERHGLAGATYMAAAYAAALLLYPTPIAVAGMLYNALGDGSAALVGKRFGRHRTSWGKSWEGFAAAGVVNLAVGLLLPGIPAPSAAIGALAAAILEFIPVRLDDNLRVALGGATVLWASTLLF
ncbi:MAG: hypothetical protein M3P24_09345 [Gemmatimonadota bacterium]|nr:hypothetical protein [Gemmatimonadota bacterium]